MSLEVLLIRHAESELNLQSHLIVGRSNWVPLSERGEQQAEELGRCLVANCFIPERVISSPAVRAQETARRSLKAMNIDLDIEIRDGFQEVDQGDWEGMEREKIYSPDRNNYIQELNGHFAAPNGESRIQAARRMHSSLEQLAFEAESYTSIHIYSHGFAIRSLVGLLLNWDHQEILERHTANTSITRLVREDDWVVTDFGRVPQKIIN